METLTATAVPIPFAPTTENYALPDPKIITCLVSPSVNKHFIKKQNLFPINTQPFQPLSIVDAITAVVDNTSDDNVPTPPLSAGLAESPTSVKMNDDIPETPTIEEVDYHNDIDNFSKASPIHLHCLPVSDDVLVSLLKREIEIRDLVKVNEDFFAMVKATIHSDILWEKFEKILYMRREELPDEKWMLQLSEFLIVTPALLMKFKDIVGYSGDDIPFDNTSYLDITLIRNYPEKLGSFEKSYPEFFANAFQHFDQNDDLYTEFKRVLFATRHEMSDEEWEDRLHEALSRSPSLLGQFEDIIVTYDLL